MAVSRAATSSRAGWPKSATRPSTPRAPRFCRNSNQDGMVCNVGASSADFNYRVALGRSRRAALFVLVSGAATLVLLAAIPLAWTVKLAAAAWVGATWLAAFRAVVRQVGSGGASEIVVRGDEIDVRNAFGSWRSGRIRSGSFVAPW